jgi:hypothetical protein
MDSWDWFNFHNHLTKLENTIRLLFSAQKKQLSPSLSPTEEVAPSPPPPIAESIDPRQQTLHKFFQSVKVSTSSMQVKCIQQKHDALVTLQNDTIQDPPGKDLANGAVENNTDNDLPQATDMDIDVNMEITDTNQFH